MPQFSGSGFLATSTTFFLPNGAGQCSRSIAKLLDKYGLTDANPVSTPMDPNVKLDMEAKESEEASEKDDLNGYAQLIGSLIYLTLATRPDILCC